MKLFDIENRKLYIICFIPRSGSNHLCSMLERHGIGIPGEYYFPYELPERYANWNKKLKGYFNGDAAHNPVEYFRCIFKLQHSVAGIKAGWDSVQIMLDEVGDIVEKMEPQYIYVTREDKIRQAVSWAKSLLTNIWSSDDLVDGKAPEPKYSKEKIDECLGYIKFQERQFEEFLKDKDPLRITYEEISDDTIRKISEFLDVPIIAQKQFILDQYKKIGTKKNDEWYDRYASS